MRYFNLEDTRLLELLQEGNEDAFVEIYDRYWKLLYQNILTKTANTGGVIDKHYLRPIPQTVIDRDTGGYPQNAGY